MPFCQVIVDINHTDVDHVFTYRVPAGLDVCPGMRVHVPFGPRKLEGVVVEMAADCDLPPERVKDICDTLEDYPAVLPPLLEWHALKGRPGMADQARMTPMLDQYVLVYRYWLSPYNIEISTSSNS